MYFLKLLCNFSFQLRFFRLFKNCSPSGLGFSKLEILSHLHLYIHIFGDPKNFQTQTYERSLKYFAKLPARRTNTTEGQTNRMMRFLRRSKIIEVWKFKEDYTVIRELDKGKHLNMGYLNNEEVSFHSKCTLDEWDINNVSSLPFYRIDNILSGIIANYEKGDYSIFKYFKKNKNTYRASNISEKQSNEDNYNDVELKKDLYYCPYAKLCLILCCRGKGYAFVMFYEYCRNAEEKRRNRTVGMIDLRWMKDPVSHDGINYNIIPIEDIVGKVFIIPDFDSGENSIFFINEYEVFL